MTIKLPDNFFFGAALSGPQTEGAYNVGGRLRSYWDMWSRKSMLFITMLAHMSEMICITVMKKT